MKTIKPSFQFLIVITSKGCLKIFRQPLFIPLSIQNQPTPFNTIMNWYQPHHSYQHPRLCPPRSISCWLTPAASNWMRRSNRYSATALPDTDFPVSSRLTCNGCRKRNTGNGEIFWISDTEFAGFGCGIVPKSFRLSRTNRLPTWCWKGFTVPSAIRMNSNLPEGVPAWRIRWNLLSGWEKRLTG